MLSALQSAWTWAVLAALLLLWVPLVGIVRLFEKDPARYRTGRLFRSLGWVMTKVNPAWKICIDGEPIPDPRNPYVVVSNHLSMADILIISCLPWEMKWIAKVELFRIPVLGRLMRLAGDIPVDRSDGPSRARVLVRAREYLRDQCSVMVFPEGTRSCDGRLRAFSDGAFRLAIKAQVPVLPLALDGTHGALPKHSWRFGSVNVRLRVLGPIPTTGLRPEDTEELRERVRDAIAAELVAWRGVSREAVVREIETDALPVR